MTVRLEHANLFVRDVDATIRFLQTAFPEFRIRFDGRDPRGSRWVHIGTDDTYIALTQSTVGPEQRWTPYVGVPGVNHLAYEVDDVEALRKRLKSAGYKDSTVPNKHAYRKRVSFYDPDGNDWEFIQYLSDAPAKRHAFSNIAFPSQPAMVQPARGGPALIIALGLYGVISFFIGVVHTNPFVGGSHHKSRLLERSTQRNNTCPLTAPL